MKHKLATVSLAAALFASSAFAQSATDLSGTWTGSYIAASPANSNKPFPRFGKAEWRLDITHQEENAFFGTSQWRYDGGDWTKYQATGSIRSDGSGVVSILEAAENPPYTVNSVSNGQLIDDKIYIDFQGLRLGTSYSTVLEKQD
ncbi:MAG: hypothetical protein AAGF94_18345 [Pseudomonadota bacterium]